MKKQNLIRKKRLIELATASLVLLAQAPVESHSINRDKEATGVLLAGACGTSSGSCATSAACGSCGVTSNAGSTSTTNPSRDQNTYQRYQRSGYENMPNDNRSDLNRPPEMYGSGTSSYQGTTTGPGPNGGYPATPKGAYPVESPSNYQSSGR
jgi:hypothetical protein